MLVDGSSVAAGLQEHLRRTLSERVGFLCLSAVHDNLLMWAHYCCSHEGLVVALDTGKPGFRSLGKNGRITYREDRPSYDVTVGPKDEDYWVKSRDWSYEQEYRVLRMLDQCEIVFGSAGLPLYFAPLPLACISAVYLGVRMRPGEKNRVRDALKNTSILVSEVSLDRKRFALHLI